MTQYRSFTGLPVLLLVLLLSACQADTVEFEPKLTLTSDDFAMGSDTFIMDFQEVPLDTRATFSFVLKNEGTAALTLQSVTLVNGSLSIFDVQWDRITELEPGVSSTVQVTFIPAKVQSYTGRIQIRSTDEALSSILIDVKGEGAPSTVDKDGDGYSPADGDCNDGDAQLYPGNVETCDGKDNDCDGIAPANEANADGDSQRICSGDCDDTNKNTYVGAPEICDGKDNDCDGTEADGLDANDDGVPDGDYDLDADGASICSGDCNDDDDSVSPGLAEICDDRDNDCDGKADNIDQDNDSYSLCDPAGDCNDLDALAHPTYVDASFRGTAVGTYAAPYASLNAALEGLDATCRTVYAAAGAYTLSATDLSDGRTLTLRGASAETVSIKPAATGRFFTVTNRSKLILEHLGLTGGNATGDGGVVLAQNGDVTLTQVVASANKASADGGVVFVQSGKLSISESIFSANTAGDDGGAVVVLSGEYSDNGSQYVGNQGAKGGAVSLQSSKMTSVQNLYFEGNAASDAGGGLFAIGVSQFRLETSRFWSNSAENEGGGVALNDVIDSSGYLRNCLFQNNATPGGGGGILLAGVQGVVILNNTLVENSAEGEGGGIRVSTTADQSRVAGSNDWMRVTGPSLSLIPSAATPQLLANIIAWTHGDSGLYIEGPGSTVMYNTVFNTDSGVNYGGAGIDPTDLLFSSSLGDYNLTDNPLFVQFEPEGEPSEDDLHLQSSSTSRNSGPSSDSYDDKDGSRNDRGAYGGPTPISTLSLKNP